MHTLRTNIIASLILWLIITAAAWPIFVAANYAISMFIGEGSIIDKWDQIPKRSIVTDFVHGYKSSALIASLIGLIAVVDFQLFSRNNLTGFIAGILVPVSCVALAFIYFPEPGHVVPGFALTGLGLWILYKLVDIGCRVRRVN